MQVAQFQLSGGSQESQMRTAHWKGTRARGAMWTLIRPLTTRDEYGVQLIMGLLTKPPIKPVSMRSPSQPSQVPTGIELKLGICHPNKTVQM